mgnify:FL=1|jgi:hypothetical protein|tara:strand:- start:419 stop:709 length:291 start_codon:yes stop_codon:yes gene_type:complete
MTCSTKSQKSKSANKKKVASITIKRNDHKKLSEDILEEIKDYFRNQKDEDYLQFDGHPLSDVESLMDPEKPAPWDHLNNDEDDEDLDIDIKENIKK